MKHVSTLLVIFSMIIAILYAVIYRYMFILKPYMDEIFHIPQAQAYCQGRFDEWNPKITTFPGLYIISSILYFPISGYLECGFEYLRGINFLFFLLLPYLLFKCREKIVGPMVSFDDLSPMILFFYPITFFFGYLYYTETMSTFVLLSSYYLSLSLSITSPFTSKALLLLNLGLFLLTRQTNVIWILFFMGTTILRDFEMRKIFRDESYGVMSLFHFLFGLWKEKWNIISLCWPFIIPVAGFIVFLVKNGSIVVGDKENHVAGIHPAMVAHLILLSTIVSLPKLLDDYLHSDGKSKLSLSLGSLSFSTVLLGGLIFTVGALMLVYGSKSHPFLLSDNRHYVFYVWQRVLGKHSFRIILAPFYGLSTIFFLWNLSRSRGLIWILIFLVAISLTLLPTPLLEPRYFTPGICIGLLNTPKQFRDSYRFPIFQFLTIIAFIILNFIFFHVYLYKSFFWGDGTVARFMF